MSQRRCAQMGVVAAGMMLVMMLTILFYGGQEAISGQHRIGVKMSAAHDAEPWVHNVKLATVGK